MQIKSHCLIENLQPQCAAYLAVAEGARSIAPTPGNSLLMLDIGTSLASEREIAKFLKSRAFLEAKGLCCERLGPILQLHAANAEDLKTIAGTTGTGGKEPDVTIEAAILMEDIAPDYAAMANRSSKGMMVLPGDNLFMIECSPMNRIAQLANRIEASFPRVELVHLDTRSGRATLKGSYGLLSKIRTAVDRDKS